MVGITYYARSTPDDPVWHEVVQVDAAAFAPVQRTALCGAAPAEPRGWYWLVHEQAWATLPEEKRAQVCPLCRQTLRPAAVGH